MEETAQLVPPNPARETPTSTKKKEKPKVFLKKKRQGDVRVSEGCPMLIKKTVLAAFLLVTLSEGCSKQEDTPRKPKMARSVEKGSSEIAKMTGEKGEIICPQGEPADPEGKCVADEEKNVSPLSARTGKTLMQKEDEEKIVCPQGEIADAEGKCGADEGKITCPQGETADAEGKCGADEGKITCPQGETADAEGKCVADEGKIACLQGEIADAEGKCVQIITCEADERPNPKNQCVDQSECVAGGYIWDATASSCREPLETECTAVNFAWNETDQKCELTAKTLCVTEHGGDEMWWDETNATCRVPIVIPNRMPEIDAAVSHPDAPDSPIIYYLIKDKVISVNKWGYITSSGKTIREVFKKPGGQEFLIGDWSSGISAASYVERADGHYFYFFKGNKLLKLKTDFSSASEQILPESWPTEFQRDLDAVVLDHDKNLQIFKGYLFITVNSENLSIISDPTATYLDNRAKLIASDAGYSHMGDFKFIDAAVNKKLDTTEFGNEFFFFQGSKYLRVDFGTKSADVLSQRNLVKDLTTGSIRLPKGAFEYCLFTKEEKSDADSPCVDMSPDKWTWKDVGPEVMSQVSSGEFGVWATTLVGQNYYREGISSANPTGTNWKWIDGGLKQISSGTLGVWGVRPLVIMGAVVEPNQSYYRAGIGSGTPTGTNWDLVSSQPELKQISSGALGVWGVDPYNQIYYRIGITSSTPKGTAWERIDGALSQISSGTLGVFGVNPTNEIYYRIIDGALSQISSGTLGVFGVNPTNEIYYRIGITSSTPKGTAWAKIGGVLKQISSGTLGVWGVNAAGKIYYLLPTVPWPLP
ncbi:MAG: hypothetical protein HYW48_06335 [Deltaproteobacteria bacterium]|nr:hypothetical protein [Deltaproteobacteria bacterium]